MSQIVRLFNHMSEIIIYHVHKIVLVFYGIYKIFSGACQFDDFNVIATCTLLKTYISTHMLN